MKKYIALCCVLSGMLFGCNESKFLREVPEDFMIGICAGRRLPTD